MGVMISSGGASTAAQTGGLGARSASLPPSAGKTPLQAMANGIDELGAILKNGVQHGTLNALVNGSQLTALHLPQATATASQIAAPALKACAEVLSMGPVAKAAIKSGKTGASLAASVIRKIATLGLA